MSTSHEFEARCEHADEVETSTTDRLDKVRSSVKPGRRRTAGAIGVCGAVVASMLALAGPASATACDARENISINGDGKNFYRQAGESHYTVSCRGGGVFVSGYVKDTLPDGKCVQVRVVYNNGSQYSDKACPDPSTKTFDLKGPGPVSVYTYLI